MLPQKEDMVDALIKRHGEELQNQFSGATVAVCGLGGLGSNVAIHLARAGIGKLLIIDYDKVDIANLNRQQYKAYQVGEYKTKALFENLREIAPYMDIKLHTEKITEENAEELLKDADVICEAFDDAEAKAMIVNAVLEKMPEKYIVAASGMAGMESANLIKTRKISKRFYLVGDNVSGVSKDSGLISSRVAVCAAHQAHVILRILAGKFNE